MKHRASSTHMMDDPDRHNGQKDERTNERANAKNGERLVSSSVRSFVA